MQYFQAYDELLLHVAPANRGTRNVQPFLVCSKKGQERKGIYYIMVDDHLIKIACQKEVIGTINIVIAVWIFCILYIFSILFMNMLYIKAFIVIANNIIILLNYLNYF